MMKRYVLSLSSSMALLSLLLLLGASCVSESRFSKSDRNTPTEIRMRHQLSSRILYGDGTQAKPDTAFVLMPDDVDFAALEIDYIAVPSLTEIRPAFRTVRDFREPVTFELVAENEVNRRLMVVKVEIGRYELQLPYFELNQWFEMGQFSNGDGYYAIGEKGASTPWANTNVVTQILGKAACIPSEFPRPSGHVVLETLMNRTAGNTVGSGIASADFFAGNFRSNPNFFIDRDKQMDNVSFGVPYKRRPTSVSFEYKYKPGTQMEIWEQNSVALPKWIGRDVNAVDSMEMFCILHNRIFDEVNPQQSRYVRVAVGGYISAETVGEWRKLTIPLHYGKPDQAYRSAHPEAYRMFDIEVPLKPRFVHQHNPVQNSTDPTKWSYTAYRIAEEWSTHPADEVITHLSLSFSASSGGREYRGAGSDAARERVGSKLEIRNVLFAE